MDFSFSHNYLKKIGFLRELAFASVLSWLVCIQAHGQTAPNPSQLLPQNIRPTTPSPLGAPLTSGPLEIQAPKGSAGAYVTLSHILIDGEFNDMRPATQALIAGFIGHKHAVKDFYELANQIEQLYAQKGYILARINVPPQKLTSNGTLRLHITDGFIQSIDSSSVPANLRELIYKRMQPIIGLHQLTLDALERALLLAGRLAGVTLKSTLSRGDVEGSSKIILEATQKTFAFTVTLDNRLPTSTGTWEQASNLTLNNISGYGEQTYTTFASSSDLNHAFDSSTHLRTFAIGTIIPLGADGWALNPEYTYSRSRPTPTAGTAQALSHYQRLAMRVSYDAILTRTQSLTYSIGIEDIAQSTHYEASLLDISRDHYRVARLSTALETTLPWLNRQLQFTTTFSQGLGGRQGDNVPLTRQNAGTDFSKITLDGRLTTPLSSDTNFVLFPHAQTSFGKAVLGAEQMALDGTQSISSVPSGSFSVDEGATLRAELQKTIIISDVKAPLLPYLFAAAGYGVLNAPTSVEKSPLRAAAFGLGLRSQYALSKDNNLTFSAEGAREFSNAISTLRAWRSFLSMSISF